MLDDIFGPGAMFVLNLLPIEVVIIAVVMLILHKTGSLERMAKTTNIWIRAHMNADKARKEFKQQLELIETGQERELETLQVEARLQSQATYSLENQRFRQELFELTQAHIVFLEAEISKNNEFLRCLINQVKLPIPIDIIETSNDEIKP